MKVNYVTGNKEVMNTPGVKIYMPFLENVFTLDKTPQKFVMTGNRSNEDNRVVLVEPTDAGRKLAAETPLGGIALLRRRLPTLEPQRLARINAALADIMELMEVPESE